MVRSRTFLKRLPAWHCSTGRRGLESPVARPLSLSSSSCGCTVAAGLHRLVYRNLRFLLVASRASRGEFSLECLPPVHHSPARNELLTAFYKHPVEIAVDSVLMSALMFSLLGASLAGAARFNVLAVFGEYFYHSNIRTPRWFGYFPQRPEHYSIHHELDVHKFNFGDITSWDRLFGTFREADDFAPRYGFPADHERNLGSMLLFRDVY
jgi:hypothetical protein